MGLHTNYKYIQHEYVPLQVTEYIQMASLHQVEMDTHNVTSVELYYLDQSLAAFEVSTVTISTSK